MTHRSAKPQDRHSAMNMALPHTDLVMQALILLASASDTSAADTVTAIVKLLSDRLGGPVCLFRIDADNTPTLLRQWPAALGDAVSRQSHGDLVLMAAKSGTAAAGASLAIAADGDNPLVLILDRGDSAERPDPDLMPQIRRVLTGLTAFLARVQTNALTTNILAATEALDQGIAIYAASGDLSYSNATFRRFFHDYDDGLARFDTMRTLIDTLIQRTLEEFDPSYLELLESDPHTVDSRIELSDGRVLNTDIKQLANGTHLISCNDITEIVLRKKRLLAAIDGSGVGTWEWTVATGENRINQRWANMLGYDRDELTPMTIDAFKLLVTPEYAQEMELRRGTILENSSDIFEHEFQMYHKNGHRIWVLSRGRVTSYDADGRPAVMSGMHLEITDLKLTQERLSHLVEGARIGTWDWDVVTDEQRGNQQWAEMLGYTAEEVAPITYDRWRNLVHPDDIAEVEAKMALCLSGKADSLVAEYRMLHKNGGWIWMIDRAKVLSRTRDGKAAFIVGIQIEISEQKAREEALRSAKTALELAFADKNRAEKRLTDIAAVSDDWFWDQDRDLKFQFFSHLLFLGDATGERGHLLGRRWQDWLEHCPHERDSADWAALFATLDRHQPFRDFVFMMTSETKGETRWLRFSGAPVFDEHGTFNGYRGVGSDVTQYYLAKFRAEVANQSKSMFLANMSHEIRTPLNGVLGMAEVLELSLVDPNHKRMIATIRNSGESLLSILNDILDMSKIEAGKLELEQVPFDPAELAAQIEELHKLQAEEKGLHFEVTVGISAEHSRIGDPHRLRQILNNLISNAIKFTETGEVMVRLTGKSGRPLVIEVNDTGIGMTDQQIAHIHDEFVQADSSITRRYGGTGLGMAITRTLVEMMKGQISVTSELGVGTRMAVTLPLESSDDRVKPRDPVATGDAPLAGLHILIADDNPTNRVVLEHMLQQLGATSVATKDGLEALTAWQGSKFSAVLLDIAMPVMDGKTAIQKIRAEEQKSGLPATPIIAVTANVMPYQISDYIEVGFDTTVAKPVSSKQLAHAIRSLLGQT
ncbi:MAG: PAS domain-containing protein [bacterium]